MPFNVSDLMNPYSLRHCIVWFYVTIRNFLLEYSGCAIFEIVVRIGVEFAQEICNMFMRRRVSRFPSIREYNMLVDKRRVGNDARFLIFRLIKRNGQRLYFFLYFFFKLGTAVIRFNPRFLRAIGVYHPGYGHGRYVRWFVRKDNIGNQRE